MRCSDLKPHFIKMGTLTTDSTLRITLDETGSIDKSSCQICFDTSFNVIVGSLCSDRCTAVVCSPCLSRHLQVTMRDTIPGILPRIRCPVCLRHMPKSRWTRRVYSPDVTAMFEALCAKACAFLPPCCHEESYTHLPPSPQTVDFLLANDLHALQDTLKRFQAYEIQPCEMVRAIEAAARRSQAENMDATCVDMVETLLGCTVDDERRASLLIAFHSIYKRVTTRCCSSSVCFNCKRKWDDHHDADPHAPCDPIDLTQHDMLQCRCCRATLVKVEGCNTVTCPCGFTMHWTHELQLRDDVTRGLVPIDVYDIELYGSWRQWCTDIRSYVLYQARALREKWRMQHIARAISQWGTLLRRMLQRFIWRRRFCALVASLERHAHAAQLQLLLRRLQRCMAFLCAVRRVPRRLQWRRCMRSIADRRYDEELLMADELTLARGLFD